MGIRKSTAAYQLGETVQLELETLDNAPESPTFNQPIDPDGGPPEVEITAPDGQVDQAFTQMAMVATGLWRFAYDTDGKATGQYGARFQATHEGNVSIQRDTFRLDV